MSSRRSVQSTSKVVWIAVSFALGVSGLAPAAATDCTQSTRRRPRLFSECQRHEQTVTLDTASCRRTTWICCRAAALRRPLTLWRVRCLT
jgi:hypothetical protein